MDNCEEDDVLFNIQGKSLIILFEIFTISFTSLLFMMTILRINLAVFHKDQMIEYRSMHRHRLCLWQHNKV